MHVGEQSGREGYLPTKKAVGEGIVHNGCTCKPSCIHTLSLLLLPSRGHSTWLTTKALGDQGAQVATVAHPMAWHVAAVGAATPVMSMGTSIVLQEWKCRTCMYVTGDTSCPVSALKLAVNRFVSAVGMRMVHGLASRVNSTRESLCSSETMDTVDGLCINPSVARAQVGLGLWRVHGKCTYW